MFWHKKRLKQIEKEKKELLFIKALLEDSTPKINISNVYVWEDKGVYSLVHLNVEKIQGITYRSHGELVDGYQSTLVDIFSNNIIYKKSAISQIEEKEWVLSTPPYYARLLRLHKIDKNILAYADKEVPLYVLQQLYYRLNNVDVNAYAIKKQK